MAAGGRRRRRRLSGRAWLPAIVALVVVCVAPTPARANPSAPWDGDWHYSVSPSAWLPGIHADLRVQAQGHALEGSSGDIWDDLSGALMISADARKGRWGLYGDLDWVRFTNHDARIREFDRRRFSGTGSGSLRWGVKGGIVTLGGLYTLVHGARGYADFLYGVRYLWIKANVGWDVSLAGAEGGAPWTASGQQARNTHVTDVVVGIKGRWMPGAGRLFVPYYLDVGVGGATPTAQAGLGIGYAFRSWDAALGWRYLRYRENDSGAILRSVDFSGPALTLTWQF